MVCRQMEEINKNSRLPLYHQLVDILLDDIEQGKISENDKLPSERELCDAYDISRSTVRQAILELEKLGYVYKHHGKGTFISPKALNQDLLQFYSFTDEMVKLGKIPSSKVLSFGIVDCNLKVARKLKCNEFDKVYEIVRLRLADDEPMMYEQTYLPCNRFANLSSKEIEKSPMYDVFRSKYGVKLTKAEEELQPVKTRRHEAKLLEVDESVPSMMIERITFENDAIIEYTVGIARGDRFKYRVVLK